MNREPSLGGGRAQVLLGCRGEEGGAEGLGRSAHNDKKQVAR